MTLRPRLLCALILMLAVAGPAFGEQADWQATVSLNFTDAPIQAVLREIGSAGNLRFVFDEKVDPGARASISLSDVSVLNALRFVTRSNRLFFIDQGEGTIFVAPDTRQKRQQHMAEEIRAFALEHADTKNVITVLRSLLQARSLVEDTRLRTVTMKDTTDQLDVAEALIGRLDLGGSPDPDAPEREPLWVGNEYSQDMCSIGDPFPELEVDMNRVVAFDSANATVRGLYDDLAEGSGIQFVFADEVDLRKEVSFTPSTMPVQAALEALERKLSLFHVIWGPRTVFVSPDSRGRRLAEEHVGVQFFYLDHADPKAVITAIRGLIQTRQMAEIPRLNAVVMKDNVAQLETARDLVAEMDRPAPR